MGNMVIFRDNTVIPGITSFVGGLDVGNGTLIARTLSAENTWIAEWAAGVEFYAGAGQIAGARRLLFCAGTQEVAVDPQGAWDLSAEGEKVLRNAIKYMLTAPVPPAPEPPAPPAPEPPAPPAPEPPAPPPIPPLSEGRRIAAGTDDAEERLIGALYEMDITSSDLELAWEDFFQGDKQIVGLRFTDITIPKGTTIKKAYVQFDVDETKGGTYPVFLLIDGELSVNAATFSATARDITSRPRTKANVLWHVRAWTVEHEHGPAQATPDIASIIQEIVNQDGWVSGNSLVLIFRDSSLISTGIRCAESFEGAGSNIEQIPTLFVTY